MKARIKLTGEIIEVYPSIHKEYDYDGSDGYSYAKEDLIILDDEPDYWTRLEHTYIGMAMQGILSNPEVNLDYKSDKYMPQAVAATAYKIAHTLVEKLKEEEK